MRVIQIVDNLNFGGTERMSVNISNALHKDGNQVMLIVARTMGPLVKNVNAGVQIVCLEKKSFFDILAWRNFFLAIRGFRPNVIHAHSTSIYWAIVVSLLFFWRVKLIFHDHFGLSESLKDQSRLLLRLTSFRIDFVISANDLLRNWSKRNLRVKDERIQFIRNFPADLGIVKTENSLQKNILCLANFRSQKDHPTLIRAFKILIDRNLNFSTKLILAGVLYHDDYQRMLFDMIKVNQLTDFVHIVGPVSEIENVLNQASIGVLSSISEGLPVSLLEYGLAGLPVVVTDVGQCSEVIEGGKFGLLVSAGDPTSLADALEFLIVNESAALQIGNEFREHVVNQFGANYFLKAYYNLLNA